ncbi:MAG: ATP synthase subunit I [bacterium]|nr:MAG: ATP synthase subunit I [bacterium]
MRAFDRYVRRVFFGTLTIILTCAGIFLLVGLNRWARGVALGGAASLVNLLVMASDVRRQGAMAVERGMRPGYGRYALRMAVMAAALIYSARSADIALWATIPSLFASQAAMTAGELLGGREQGAP